VRYDVVVASKQRLAYDPRSIRVNGRSNWPAFVDAGFPLKKRVASVREPPRSEGGREREGDRRTALCDGKVRVNSLRSPLSSVLDLDTRETERCPRERTENESSERARRTTKMTANLIGSSSREDPLANSGSYSYASNTRLAVTHPYK
jgi:hypothetical protein